MQPIRDTFRKVALSVMFVSSLVAICIMSTSAKADDILGQAETAAYMTEAQALELEVLADVEAVEARDDKIALFVDYVQVHGVTTVLEGEEVYAPARFFSESMLDCKVTYYESTQTLKVSAEGLSFEATAGKSYVVANGRYLYLKEGISIREDGQIWLPLSMLSKIFGCEYKLDLESKSAHLIPTGKFIENGKTYYNSKDLYWLSRIINAEARGESLLGQVAVGTVVMNRVAHPRYPNTVYGVVFDGSQFSPAVSGSIYKEPTESCVIAAKIVLEGYRVSESILFFHSIRSNNFDNFVNTDTEMVIDHQFYYTYYNR